MIWKRLRVAELRCSKGRVSFGIHISRRSIPKGTDLRKIESLLLKLLFFETVRSRGILLRFLLLPHMFSGCLSFGARGDLC